MGLLGSISRIGSALTRNPEDPRSSLSNPSTWLRVFFGGDTTAGVQVTEKSSLSLTAVYCANRVISENVAQLPLKVYRKQDRETLEQRDHPLFQKLQNAPNPHMTSIMMRQTVQTLVNLWGNGYAEIKRDSRTFRPTSLVPIEAWRVTPKVTGRRLVYEVNEDGKEKRDIDDANMIHIPGLSFNGLEGKSPIAVAREGVANAKAAQEYGNRFYANGASPKGVLATDENLTQDQMDRIQGSWDDRHQGVGNAHKTAVLPFGLKYNKIEIPPNEAQFLETRQFSIKEIARLFNVPPHMLMDLENANYSNIVEQDLSFVKYTIGPWLRKWEQELNRKLLTEAEKEQGFFIEHELKGLLRGDIDTRTKHYKAMLQSGVYTPNEIRQLENFNPIDGGDEPLPPHQDPSGNSPDREEESFTKHKKNGHSVH